MSALAFERVTYTYPDAARPALRDVTLAIEPGELCVLAGLSGHGKSTLLRAACGLVPHFHGGRFAGRVTIEGRDTREHPPARLGELTGVLFQDPETQLVMGSVRAELALPLESRGHAAAEVARSVEEVALALGIERLLERSTHELSGGEQQRVAVARALINDPALVLADEPTGNLDPDLALDIMNLFREINARGTTVLVATHDRELIRRVGRRTVTLEQGRIVEGG
jgi:energy-coupling factor transport system ATP-binding protein